MNPPQWLEGDEARAWRGLTTMMAGLDAALDDQLRRDAGIAHSTYMILAVLSEQPGGCLRMTDLAHLTHSSQSRLSHAVARLEEEGSIVRTRSADDRRIVTAVLTERGWDQIRAAAPGHVAQVRRVLIDQLSAEQLVQLTEITATAIASLADAGFAPPRWLTGRPGAEAAAGTGAAGSDRAVAEG